MKGPVTQEWVHSLTFMQQSVLLSAIRGPDGHGKYNKAKMLLRWYRRCILISAMDGKVLTNPWEEGGGSFTGPSVKQRVVFHPTDEKDYHIMNKLGADMQPIISEYIRASDELPHHFQTHFMHAIQIVGYKHPDLYIREFWLQVYRRIVNNLHLHPETEKEMDLRLGDNREQWLERNDKSTVE